MVFANMTVTLSGFDLRDLKLLLKLNCLIFSNSVEKDGGFVDIDLRALELLLKSEFENFFNLVERDANLQILI
ncbi:hypothetical protein RHMOL_Rhmol12G0111200 [Rhododendron molle]|uniref:Uncharacterized protein n=1 Tax=Rhododendron molle TaxID=49168 RepID=A0ACC0LGP1_RHOML|nr:hypothetical protein RHMOL_Rhmol12G0111200 [Rhododendron molle]